MTDSGQPRNPDGTFGFKAGGLLAAVVIGVSAAVSAGAGSAAPGAAGATGTAGAVGAVAGADTPSVSVQVRSARGSRRSGRTQARLALRGLREVARTERDSGSCAADARGQVRDFLATHRCQSVYRAVFVLRRGDVAALVAVAWIDMVSLDDATALKALVDQPGTGNINQAPLPRGQRAINVGDPAYASRQQGRLVVTVEAQPVAVTREQRVLAEIAQSAADSANDPS